MLKVMNVEYFHQVLKEIEQCDQLQDGVNRLEEGLLEQLRYLNHYGNPGEWEVELWPDFAYWSFGVNWVRGDRRWFNGGLIFHSGAGMNDGTFAVELVGSSKPHWAVHT